MFPERLRGRARPGRALARLTGVGLLVSACTTGAHREPAPPPAFSGIHKIQHVVVIMQENRSFDSYFGTFPGADGIPMRDGQPTVCLPDGQGSCVQPFHNPNDVNGGGPHGQEAAVADIDNAKMDGFVRSGGKRPPGLPGRDRPGLHQRHGQSTSWGGRTPGRSPTTGATPGTTSSRTACSSPTRRGACPPTCSSFRNGRPIAPGPAMPPAAPTPSRTPGTRPMPAVRSPSPHRSPRPTTPGPTSPT